MKPEQALQIIALAVNKAVKAGVFESIADAQGVGMALQIIAETLKKQQQISE